jgi:hypothetical protein
MAPAWGSRPARWKGTGVLAWDRGNGPPAIARASLWMAILLAGTSLAGCGRSLASAPVAGTPASVAASAALAPTFAQGPATTVDLPEVRAAQLLTPVAGWALTTRDLRWTADGGGTWTTITPPGVRVDRLRSVSFLDLLHGWAIVSGDPDAAHRTGLRVLRSEDGGHAWQEGELGGPSVLYTDAPLGFAAIDFLDTQHGWVTITLGSSSNFSRSELFQTTDGGATWRKLTTPSGAPVRFATLTDGWVAAGPLKDRLYVSRDGGESWQSQAVTPPERFAASRPAFGPPTFFDGQHGVLPVTFTGGDATAPAGLGFYTTQDGGQSWDLALAVAEQASLGAGVTLQTQVLSATTWVVVHAGGWRITITRDGGRTTALVTPTGLPVRVFGIAFASDTTGWVWAAEAECPGPATQAAGKMACHDTPVRLFRTTDGGQIWTPLSP